MSTSSQMWERSATMVLPGMETESWYAVQTRARHEKVVATQLHEKGIPVFYPTVKEVHRWSDRKKTVEMPLFSCYLFVKMKLENEERQRVLRTNSVLGFAGDPGWGTPIPEAQIDAVRTLIDEQLPYVCHPFLKTGQRVRVRNGALEGCEGILLSRKGDQRLVISVDAMQRSLAVQIDGCDVEPV